MNKEKFNTGSYLEIVIYVPESLTDPLSSYISDNLTASVIFEETENSEITGVKFVMEESAHVNQLNDLRHYLSQIAEINSVSVPEIHEKIIESVDSEENYRKSVEPMIP